MGFTQIVHKSVICFRTEGTGPENKGVRILSTQDITVYCVNKEQFTTDAYVALPVNVVGQEYYAMCYISNAQILLIGVSDSTSVTVKLSDNSRTGSAKSVSSVSISYGGSTYGNGQSFSFTVNRYQTWFVTQWVDTSSDLTGSYITSNKPISCISGNYRSWIPKGTSSSDHLTGKYFCFKFSSVRCSYYVLQLKMLPSVDTWGKEFVTVSTPDRSIGDLFRVVCAEDNTAVNFGNGRHTFTLSRAGDFREQITKLTSARSSPSSSSWSSVTGSTTWQQTWLYVNPGSHNLYHSDPTVTFMALATGTEQYNSYAFIAGTRMAQINTVCVPTSPTPGDTVDNDCDGRIDEEALNSLDDDGDGAIDEDLALPPRVDGNWGQWTSYGSCSVSCGAVGTKVRTRACDDPAPQNNGEDCQGSGSQSQSCDMTGTPCPVNGGWTNWSGWTSCSVTCGTGDQFNYRSCTNPAPAHGGSDCSGVDTQTRSCDTGVSCAVHGAWGTWGAWSACSLSCGGIGTVERTRVCDRPAPLHGGNYCPGSDTSTDTCDMSYQLCPNGNPWQPLFFSPPTVAPVDGGVSPWGAWQKCTVTCGGGTTMRQRFCNNPVPMGQGAQCSEPLIEEQMCNKQACSANGGLFDCKNGIQCIDIKLKCDCVPHCLDFSDEEMAYAGCVMDLLDCFSGAGFKDLKVSLGVAALVASLTVFRMIYVTATSALATTATAVEMARVSGIGSDAALPSSQSQT
ncbi:uncharacterized protein LOC101853604 [Aplysia californica]|uniref:Uncharacterized protein LOC101853604 n=1 Tax=Aplysia californica TaxID=6500 RepID=A0ABM1VP80_APLCA|nr:uncharacterized protein LOC101853604 [Aplysia californica]